VFDVSQYRPPQGLTYYVGYPSSSDSQDGMSRTSSFSSVSKALSMPDVGTIILCPRRYARDQGQFTIRDKSLSIIADGGVARIGAEDPLVWEPQPTATYTYRAKCSGVQAVFDERLLDGKGDFSRLTSCSTYSGVGELAPGRWCSDGTYVWVRATDSRGLIGDTKLHVYLESGCRIAGSSKVYLDGLCIEGGASALTVTNDDATSVPTVYARDCTFAYAGRYACISAKGAMTFLQRCVAKGGAGDAFSYHSNLGVPCHSAEIDCVGRDTGWADTHTNNGSTAHGGSSVVRLSGLYYDTDGPVVADVNADTASWNVACRAWGSTCPSGATNASYNSQCSGSGAMWLDECSSKSGSAPANTYDLVANLGGRIYTRNCPGPTNAYVSADSVLQPY
jgi:hypothetical protein